MKKKALTIIMSTVAFAAVLLAGGGLWWANNGQKVFSQLEQILTQETTETLGTEVTVGSLKIDGLKTAIINNFTITDNNGKIIVSIEELSANFSLMSFLKNQNPLGMIESVVIKNPHIFLRQTTDERWNIQDINIKESGDEDRFTGKILIDNGMLTISTPQGQWEAKNLSGWADCAKWPKTQIKLNFTHQETPSEETPSESEIQGIIDIKTSQMSLAAKTDYIYLPNYQKLVPSEIPLTFEAGKVTGINIDLINLEKALKFEKLEYKGEFKLENAEIKIDTSEWDIDPVKLDKTDAWVTFNNENIYILRAETQIAGQPFSAKGRIGLANGEPVFDLMAHSSGLDLKELSTEMPKLLPIQAEGTAAFTAYLNGTFKNPEANARVKLEKGKFENFSIDEASAILTLKDNILNVGQGTTVQAFGGNVKLAGVVDLEKQDYMFALSGRDISSAQVASSAGFNGIDGGQAQIDLTAGGNLKKLDASEISGQLTIDSGQVSGIAFEKLHGKIQGKDGVYLISEVGVALDEGAIVTAFGKIENGNLDFAVGGEQIQIGTLPFAQIKENEVKGTVAFNGNLRGSMLNPEADISFEINNCQAKGISYGKSYGSLNLRGSQLILNDVTVEDNTGSHHLAGNIEFNSGNPFLNVTATTKSIRAETIAGLIGPEYKLTGYLDHQVTFTGTLDNFNAKGQMKLYEGSYDGYLIDEADGNYEYKDGTLYLDGLTVHSIGSRIFLIGSIKPDSSLEFDIHASEINLKHLPVRYPYPVTGWIDIIGKVTGTLDDPVVSGKMTASRIRANGQILTGLTGKVDYRQNIVNIGQLSVKQGEGEFNFTGAANIQTMALDGRLTVSNARIPALLILANQHDNNIGGFLNGNILISGTMDKPSVTMTGNITDGQVKQYALGSVELNASFINNVITITKLQAEQDDGILAAQGTADLNGGIQMELVGQNLNAGLFTALFDSSFNPEGKVKFAVQASGATENPNIAVSMEVDSAGNKDAGFDNIYGLFIVNNNIVTIEQLYAQKDSYRASAQGILPLKAINPNGRSQADGSEQMDIELKLDNADLSILPLLFKEVQRASGAATGNIKLSGTLVAPKADGRISIPEGNVKLADLADPIEKIEVDIIFKGNTIAVDKFSGQIAGKPYTLTGTATIEKLGLSDYNLSLVADKIKLRHKYFNGLIDANLALNNKGQNGRPLISGTVYTENSTIEIPGLPEGQATSIDAEMNIQIGIGPKVRLYNPYLFDLLVDGKVTIAGTIESPTLAGRVESRRGTVRYLTTTFKILNGSADFMQAMGLVPNVNLSAKAKLGQSDIMLDIRGPADNMQLKLSSDPPTSQENIIKMLTLGVDLSAGNNSFNSTGQATNQIGNFLSIGLQMQAISQAENMMRRAIGIDELRLEPASMFEFRNRKGRTERNSEYSGYNLRVGKYLNDRLMISYSTSLDQHNNSIILQYDLNRRVSVSGTYGGVNNGLYVIEGRFRF